MLGSALPLIGSSNLGKSIVVSNKHIQTGTLEPVDDKKFIITDHVSKNIASVVRALHARNYPILLQGETSTGKTSLITYLAKVTGHECIRLNNHEHTDLAEYIGNYESDLKGK